MKMKLFVTIISACIVGVCTIFAAVITGCFGLFKGRNGSSVDNRVTSHGQKGGITAQSVTTTAITINNYFDRQSPDEKQALKQTLLAKYPFGYALFAVGEKTIHVPESLSFERDYVIDWTGSKLSKLEPDWVEFYPPDITHKPTGSTLRGDFYFRLKRKGRILRAYPWVLAPNKNVS